MSTTGFWKRIADTFRGSDSSVRTNGKNGAIALHLDRPANGNGHGDHNGARSDGGRLGWLGGAGRSELREGYRRTLELMDAMRMHFERQDRRFEQLAAGVDRVAQTLERLEVTARIQGESLSGIAEQSEGANRHAATLAATLLELPASMQAQVDAVRTIARQMEVSSEVSGQLVHSLQRVSHAAETLRDTNATQLTSLQQAIAGEGKRHEALTGFIREQSRRLTVITIVAAAAGIIAIGGLVTMTVLLLAR